jgi:hypothetical protein
MCNSRKGKKSVIIPIFMKKIFCFCIKNGKMSDRRKNMVNNDSTYKFIKQGLNISSVRGKGYSE